MAGYSARGWLSPESPRHGFAVPPPFGKGGLWGWVLPGGVCFPNLGVVYCCGWQPTPKAPLPMGTGGKRVPSGHNAEGVSDPQVGSETSTDHGSGLYDD